MIFIVQYLKEAYIDKVLDLDTKVYKKEHQVNRESTTQKLALNPLTDLLVIDQEEIAGYITLCPIDKFMFHQIIRTKPSDDIIESTIVPFKTVGSYYGYLTSMVINKEKYPHLTSRILFLHLRQHIERLRKRGIFFESILAHAVSLAGRKTLKRMGFREIRENIYLYICKLRSNLFYLDPPKRFPVNDLFIIFSFNRGSFV